MGLGKRLLIGRRQTTRTTWRGPTRMCPVCGEKRVVRDFQPVRKTAGHTRRPLNLFCNECRLRNPDGVRRFLHAGRPVAKVNRREVVRFFRELARRRFLKGRGLLMSAEEYAVKASKLPDRIAAIIGKTYAEMGDAAQLADDEALMMIRDVLLELDPTLIERNKNKRLARR